MMEAMETHIRNAADDLEHYGDDIRKPEFNIGNQMFPKFICPSAPTMTMDRRIDTYAHDAWIAKGQLRRELGRQQLHVMAGFHDRRRLRCRASGDLDAANTARKPSLDAGRI